MQVDVPSTGAGAPPQQAPSTEAVFSDGGIPTPLAISPGEGEVQDAEAM